VARGWRKLGGAFSPHRLVKAFSVPEGCLKEHAACLSTTPTTTTHCATYSTRWAGITHPLHATVCPLTCLTAPGITRRSLQDLVTLFCYMDNIVPHRAGGRCGRGRGMPAPTLFCSLALGTSRGRSGTNASTSRLRCCRGVPPARTSCGGGRTEEPLSPPCYSDHCSLRRVCLCSCLKIQATLLGSFCMTGGGREGLGRVAAAGDAAALLRRRCAASCSAAFESRSLRLDVVRAFPVCGATHWRSLCPAWFFLRPFCQATAPHWRADLRAAALRSVLPRRRACWHSGPAVLTPACYTCLSAIPPCSHMRT